MSHPTQPVLKLTPLGGLGEVGMNLLVIECESDAILVDCGLLFPDLSWVGLDLVVPDFSYLIQIKDKLKAIVLTHAHEDHIGAIPFLLKEVDIPIIYGGAFARRLLEDKCEEHGVLRQLNCFDVKAGDKIDIGCFNVEFIHVTHSTIQTFALAIQTPQGLIIHSGDFKFDESPYCGVPSDKARLGELGDQGPLLLLSDSTNSCNRGHTRSEKALTPSLTQLIRESEGIVVVGLFASNIHRVQQLLDIAKQSGRKVFPSGRSMEHYIKIAIELGSLNISGDLLYPIEEIGKFDKQECLVLSTGSQGQPRSSLQQLAHGENRYLKIEENDTVILSSRNIPGNERVVNALVNDFYRLKARVFYAEIADVHVSGHAAQEEQLEMLKLVRPKYFIPVHGEPRQMVVHNQTVENSGIVAPENIFYLENGMCWEFDKALGRPKVLAEAAPVGRKWVFQGEVGSFDEDCMKERKFLARSGAVGVALMLTSNKKNLACEPEITLRGFLGPKSDIPVLLRQLRKEALDAYINFDPTQSAFTNPEEAVAGACRRIFKKKYDLKPVVIVQVLPS